MAIKGYSVLPKGPALLVIRLFSIICRTLVGVCVCVCGWFLPLCRGAVGVFYNLRNLQLESTLHTRLRWCHKIQIKIKRQDFEDNLHNRGWAYVTLKTCLGDTIPTESVCKIYRFYF